MSRCGPWVDNGDGSATCNKCGDLNFEFGVPDEDDEEQR